MPVLHPDVRVRRRQVDVRLVLLAVQVAVDHLLTIHAGDELARVGALELERERLETSSALSWEQVAASIQQLIEKCKSEIAKIEKLEDPMEPMKAMLYQLA